MDTIKIPYKGHTKIIAHRGGNLEIENTSAAFLSAGNRSYYGIETDVHRTADGQYVIHHDHCTGRLTQEELSIADSDWDTLRHVHFKPYLGRLVRADTVIPTLHEYIDICRHYDKVSVVELKPAMDKAVLSEVYQAFAERGQIPNTVFISFDFTNLVLLKELYPAVPVQFLIDVTEEGLIERLRSQRFDTQQLAQPSGDTCALRLLDVLAQRHMDIDAHYPSVNAAFVKACKERGIKINLWTVDCLEDAQRFIDLGVDYITSNCLE